LRALRPHLGLDSVLAGFSTLLQPLLGAALLPRAPAGGGAEAWGPRVRVLSVVDRRGGLLGTLYVDPGGGYGTRVLRHGAWPWLPPGSGGGGGDGGKGQGDAVDGGWAAQRLWAAAEAQRSGAEPASAAWPPPLEPELVSSLQGAAAGAPAIAIGLSGPQPPGGGGSGGSGGEDEEATDALSLPLLWELSHELGHAVHLLLSSSPDVAAAAAVLAAAGGGGGGEGSGDGECAGEGDSSGGSGGGEFAASPLLSGRFLPPDLLELPSALFERLMLEPRALRAVCRRRGAPLPPAEAAALARHFRWRYGSPLAVQVGSLRR
jgi:hypothetical protein